MCQRLFLLAVVCHGIFTGTVLGAEPPSPTTDTATASLAVLLGGVRDRVDRPAGHGQARTSTACLMAAPRT